MKEQTEKIVYLIPGLGATHDAFNRLSFPGYSRKGIEWIEPVDGDDMESYAARLSAQIKHPEQAILCGLSFGGMIAIELAKILPVQKTILISSVKTRKEFPNTIKLARFLPVHRLAKANTIAKFSFWYWLPFGRTTKKDKKIIKGMIDVMDGDFTDWCANQAVLWKNKTIPPNVYHIHGTQDRVFPWFHIKNYFKIRGGTHFMIINRAKEINEIITKEILVDNQMQKAS